MTRENKLAMVVGFGLLLFVGILLSDHFSAAQRQDTARLSAADRNRDRPAPPISIAPMPAASVAVVQQTESMPMQAADVRQASAVTPISSAPELARKPVDPVAPIGARTVSNTRQESEPGVRLRPIGDGETLYAICKKEYGDGSLAGALAKYNHKVVPDPARMRKGVTLRLPPIEVLKPGAKRTAAKSEPVQAVASTPIETIAAADVVAVESRAPIGGVVSVEVADGGVKEVAAAPAAAKPKTKSTKKSKGSSSRPASN